MFLHLCVILFRGGVSVPACTTGHMTGGVSVQGGSSVRVGSLLGRPPCGNERTVRILLECILVLRCGDNKITKR